MVHLPPRKQTQSNGAPVAWICQPGEQRAIIVLQMQDWTLVPCLVSFFEEDGDLLPFQLAWDEEEEEEFGFEEEEDEFLDEEDEDEDDFFEDEEDDFDDDLDDDLDEDFDDVEVDVDEDEDEF